MCTETHLCSCPFNMVFCEVFVGRYWLIYVKLKVLYLCEEQGIPFVSNWEDLDGRAKGNRKICLKH